MFLQTVRSHPHRVVGLNGFDLTREPYAAMAHGLQHRSSRVARRLLLAVVVQADFVSRTHLAEKLVKVNAPIAAWEYGGRLLLQKDWRHLRKREGRSAAEQVSIANGRARRRCIFTLERGNARSGLELSCEQPRAS